jgi:rRNA maturation endonuclease Nob1
MDDIRKQRELVETLADTVRKTNQDLTAERIVLEEMEQQCSHEWSQPEYVGHYEPGYRIASDRERGIELGVDSRPAYDIPGRDVMKWQRTCRKCGKVETTTNTKKVSHEEPTF